MRSRVAAGGILVREGAILLGKRSGERDYYAGVWDVIGGHCLEGEAPDRALERELEEEIGVAPIEFRRLAVLQEPRPEVFGPCEFHIYLVSVWEETPELRGFEHSELGWFQKAETARLDLAHPGYSQLFRLLSKELD